MSLFDKPVQGHKVLPLKADQHACCTPCRQVCPNLPYPISERSAKRHPHRPPPLRSQQVLSNRSALFFRQSFKPLPHRLSSCPSTEENERHFLGLGASAIRHLMKYMYHKKYVFASIVWAGTRKRRATKRSHRGYYRRSNRLGWDLWLSRVGPPQTHSPIGVH